MAFFNSAVGVLQTLVIALGAGLGIWGAINLLEGYGNDNPIIEAYGSTGGAGIGCGSDGNGGNVSIDNGTVNATGGDYAAGIGGGLGVWGVVNLIEGYGGDNAAANAHVR